MWWFDLLAPQLALTPGICCFSFFHLFFSLTYFPHLQLVLKSVILLSIYDSSGIHLRTSECLWWMIVIISNSSLSFCPCSYPNSCLLTQSCPLPHTHRQSPSQLGHAPRYWSGWPSVRQFRLSFLPHLLPLLPHVFPSACLVLSHHALPMFPELPGRWYMVTLLSKVFPKFDKELPKA